jgi:hypothetical protein
LASRLDQLPVVAVTTMEGSKYGARPNTCGKQKPEFIAPQDEGHLRHKFKRLPPEEARDGALHNATPHWIAPVSEARRHGNVRSKLRRMGQEMLKIHRESPLRLLEPNIKKTFQMNIGLHSLDARNMTPMK